MNADDEKLQDYAVDVRELRGVHEPIVAKRSEIEALTAEEQNLGAVETLTDPVKERLKSQVDQLLEQWEKEKNESGIVATGSAAQQIGAGTLRFGATNPRCPGRSSQGGDGTSV